MVFVYLAVSSPIVSIIRSPNLPSFYVTDTLDMVCTARSPAVDTPTTIATLLLDPNDRPLVTNGSRLRVYSESEEDISNLTASYSSLHPSDAGRYVCSASVVSNASSLFILSSDPVNDSTTFNIGMLIMIILYASCHDYHF